MVRGLTKFREFFRDYTGSYIIIGGTACDIAMSGADLKPRATKDIDIILIVEALKPEFVLRFWEFINTGNYKYKEKSDKERKYYRFREPDNPEFPLQLELFSRNPDLLDLKEGTHLTPVPISGEIPSLSAILLDDDYYNYTLANSREEDGISLANTKALICLKSKAFLDMKAREEAGEDIPSKEIRKHKNDIFRLAALLRENASFGLEGQILKDMNDFINRIKNDLPGESVFKEMGLNNINPGELFNQLIKNFNLTLNE
jgi:hypothetical protein